MDHEIDVPKPMVLIGDDDAKLVTALCLFFKRSGFEVVAANSASQVLSAAVEMRPGLILLDRHLEGPGRGIVEELQLNPVTRGIPVVMITSDVDQSIGAVRSRVGVKFGLEFLVKLAGRKPKKAAALEV